MTVSRCNRLKRNPIGYWEVIEKPSEDDIQNYHEQVYYQKAKGSYQYEYIPDELTHLKSKIVQRA